MKRFVIGTVALGLVAMPALAGSTVTPMQGTLGDPFSNGQLSGYGWNPAAGGGAGPLIGNLYDNILTINGGAATGGLFGPFQTVPGVGAFVDWTGTAAQWGDDLHGISAGGKGPAVVTSLRYGYVNNVATSTHIIKLYDMVGPSADHGPSAPYTKGALLGQVTVVNTAIGANIVTLSFPGIQLPNSAIWIKFEEQGPGFPGTFWMTGGAGGVPNPQNGNTYGVGSSHPGLSYTLKNYYPDGSSYNYWIPFANPYLYFPGTGYVGTNIQVALSGFHIPAPAVMSLLGLGGLVTLRRRRSR